MNSLSFLLLHYFAIGLMALVSYLLGRRLTRRVSYHSLLEEVSFSVAIGLGFLAYLTMLLGLIGLLYSWLMILLLLFAVLISSPLRHFRDSRFRLAWEWFGALRKNNKLSLVVAVTALLIPICLLPLYPPTAWDSTMYHLAYAKIYTQNHQIVLTPYLRFPVFPQTNEMLFTLSLLLFDDVTAQLIQFLMMITLAMAVIAFGQRLHSQGAGWWSAAILFQSPLVLGLGSVAYIDMGLMLFVTMSVSAFWNWLQLRTQGWLIISGVMCGLAIGTKYTALFFLLGLGLIGLYRGLKDRKYKPLAVFSLLAGLVPLPWFIRNVYYTRNPVFPFFYEVFGRLFGYGLWKPDHFQGVFDDFFHYGYGRSLKSLIMLPWHILSDWKGSGMEAQISPIYFLVPILLFIPGIVAPRLRLLLGLGVAYLLFWFFGVQHGRYLMPALPLLSLAAGITLNRLLLKPELLRKYVNFKVATALGAILLISPGWIWAVLRVRERGHIPVTQEQRFDYLVQRLPSYPAYRFLNDLKGRDYTVYAIPDERMAYFADGVFVGDHFGLGRYSFITEKLDDTAALYEELRSLNVGYFLIRNEFAMSHLKQDETFRRYFKLVLSREEFLLFELA
jgi:4-amino-4-deoxy-L-arabinose transferase-like glycosyltransferase